MSQELKDIVKKGNLEEIKSILNENNINDIFRFSCKNGHLEVVKILLSLPKDEYIIDIGFDIQPDSSGGGAVIDSALMKIMAERGFDLYLSEYPNQINDWKIKWHRSRRFVTCVQFERIENKEWQNENTELSTKGGLEFCRWKQNINY